MITLIGASTGGVAALETVLPDLAPDGPPVVIVQHMPGNFLESFAERLNRALPQRVYLASEGVVLARGDVVLAPGINLHTTLRRADGRWSCHFKQGEPGALHCPSVDALFMSAVGEAGHVSAALLTGLGQDGAAGMKMLRDAGAWTFGQDEGSCVIYGMPRAAMDIGAVQVQLPLDQIGSALRATQRRRSPLDTSTCRGRPQ